MFQRVTPVTKALIVANGVIFALQYLSGSSADFSDFIEYHFALWPPQIGYPPFRPWQLLTYAFLHGNFLHLFFNALMLVQFGPRLENSLGRKRFIQFLVACTLGAAATQLGVTSWMHASGMAIGPTVGASGYIYGILLAWAVLYPHDRVMMILPPVEMSVRTMVMIFGGLEIFLGVTQTTQGVAHFAHMGGMLFGWLLLRYWQGKPPFGKRKPPPPKKPHLRSVN